MRLLDFLFKICHAPFVAYGVIGKVIAILALSPPLSFVLMAGLNLLLYLLRPVIDIHLSSVDVAIVVMILTISLFYVLNKIYVKGDRPLGKNHHPLTGLLILIFIPSSIILYAFTFKYS